MTERVTNGDFETGDLAGWSSDGMGSVAVTTASKNTGTYGCEFDAAGGSVWITQTVDLTGVSNLYIDIKAETVDTPTRVYVFFGAAELAYYDYTSAGSYETKVIDVSAYSGSDTLKIEVRVVPA